MKIRTLKTIALLGLGLLARGCTPIPAFAQSTTQIYTGVIEDLSLNPVTSGQVTFTLTPSTSATQSGTARFTPSTIACNINTNGTLSGYVGGVVSGACTVAANTAISPSGTSYRICIQAQFATPGSCFYDYALGGTKDISTVAPTLATGPINYGGVPGPTGPIGPTGPTGAAGGIILAPPANQTVVQSAGTNLWINSLNGIRYVKSDGTAFTSLASAFTEACSTTPISEVYVAATYTGTDYASSAVNSCGAIVHDARKGVQDNASLQAKWADTVAGLNVGGSIAALSKAAQTKTVRVACVGNSIWEGIYGIKPGDDACSVIFSAMKTRYPDITFVFSNFSIGGTTVLNFTDSTYKCGTNFTKGAAGTPYTGTGITPSFMAGAQFSQWPSGCTSGQSWQAIVQAFAPDVLIAGWPENSSPGSTLVFANAMNTFLNLVSTWSSNPTVVLGTDIAPNPNNTNFAGSTLTLAQEQINDVVRSIGAQNNVLVMDASRRQLGETQGFDSMFRPSNVEHSFQGYPTGYTTMVGSLTYAAGGAGTYLNGVLTAGASGGVTVRSRTAQKGLVQASFYNFANYTTAVPTVYYRCTDATCLTGYDLQGGFSPSGGGYNWNAQLYYFNAGAPTAVTGAAGSCNIASGATPLVITVTFDRGLHQAWCNDTTLLYSVYDYSSMTNGFIAYGVQVSAASITASSTFFGNITLGQVPQATSNSFYGQVTSTYSATGDYDTNPNSLGGDAFHHPSAQGTYASYVAAAADILQAFDPALKPQNAYWLRDSGGSTTRFAGIKDSGAGHLDLVAGTNGLRIVANDLTQVIGEYAASNLRFQIYKPMVFGPNPATANTSINPDGSASFQLGVSVGSLQAGAGSVINKVVYYNASISPTAVSAASCSDQAFTVTGVTTTDNLGGIAWPATLGNLSVGAKASALNTVTLHFCNPSAAAVTPPSGVYSFLAMH